jgi:hypothetical protein
MPVEAVAGVRATMVMLEMPMAIPAEAAGVPTTALAMAMAMEMATLAEAAGVLTMALRTQALAGNQPTLPITDLG